MCQMIKCNLSKFAIPSTFFPWKFFQNHSSGERKRSECLKRMAATGGFCQIWNDTTGRSWPKWLHRPHWITNVHCLQCVQCIGRPCGWPPYHITRGHLCHGLKMLQLGSGWARAVLASRLLAPKRSQLLAASLTKQGEGRKSSSKLTALRNGQEKPGLSAVAIWSSVSPHLDLGTM